MAKKELSNSKSICVLGVVVCCFAILWPKIFLPMFQSAVSLTSAPNDNQRSEASLLPPKVREAMKLSRPEEFRKIAGRPFQREAKINTNEMPTKTGGLMGLVMPLYTIGIIVFFLYTILKMVFKNKSDKEVAEDIEEESVEQEIAEKPTIKDFQMDPEYRKFILNEEYDENGKRIKFYENPKRKTKSDANKNFQKTGNIVESYGKAKVSKALHVLIRDMEEFKAKHLEVERTRRQIREIDSKKNNTSNVCSDKIQNKENNNSNQIECDFEKQNNENVVEDNENQENAENKEQKEMDSNTDSENEINDESDVSEENKYHRYPNPKQEFEIKEELIKNLETYYWESLLKGMNDLKNSKEE